MSKHEIIPLTFLFYQDIEKSPYYYKAKHQRWVRAQQAQVDRIEENLKFILNLLIKLTRALVIVLLFIGWLLQQTMKRYIGSNSPS